MIQNVPLTEICQNGLQIRVAIDERTVNDYAEAIQNGAKFPPVIVFHSLAVPPPGEIRMPSDFRRSPPADAEDVFWLADGFHRVEACRRVGRKTVKADIRAGDKTDALRYALSANSAHGLRRSNEDKRNAVKVAWENRLVLFGVDNPSSVLIAEICGVSHPFVNSQLVTVTGCRPSSTVGKDGRERPLPPLRPPLPSSGGHDDVVSLLRSEFSPKVPCLRVDADGFCTGPCEGSLCCRCAEYQPAIPPSSPLPPPDAYPEGEEHFILDEWTESAIDEPPSADVPPSLPPPPPKSISVRKKTFDQLGVEVPPELLPTWVRAPELEELLSSLSSVRVALRKAQAANDKLFLEVNFSGLLPLLDRAYGELAATKPFAVCPICQGYGSDGCRACKGRGFLGKDRYYRVIPPELQRKR